ncbi:hypothetical protein BJY01DRAFT_244894 [Aspergillus pseudoustus]|uniref:Ubiquitin 3 binding protein But2 C-terminal domain-containing protein n=1 Tax=Aspergillus pseudoustus TaxID=1810923 RepID=A0ABR4KH11_9EURO
MKLSILSLLSATSLATAATISSPSSSETNLETRQEAILWPHRTYRYWIATGAWKEDPQDQLLVVKDSNPLNESSTLVTWEVPADLAGRTCRLIFDLWDRDVSTGSQTADVFTSIEPGRRDQHVGRIWVPKPGAAEWVFTLGGRVPEFACPAGELIGFEFVGVSDAVEIRWDIGVTGPRVLVL